MIALWLIAALAGPLPPTPAFRGDTPWRVTGATFVGLTGEAPGCADPAPMAQRQCRIQLKLGSLGRALQRHWRLKARRRLADPTAYANAFGLRVLSEGAYAGNGEVIQVRFDGQFTGPGRLPGVDATQGRGVATLPVPRHPETLTLAAWRRWRPSPKADVEQLSVLVTPAPPPAPIPAPAQPAP